MKHDARKAKEEYYYGLGRVVMNLNSCRDYDSVEELRRVDMPLKRLSKITDYYSHIVVFVLLLIV